MLKITEVKVADLKQDASNPRGISPRQKAELKKSLEKFGLVEPIVVNSDMTIIGGHQRVQTAIDLGLKTVPAVMLKLTEAEAKELNIRLNKNTGFFDFDVLENFSKDDLVDWGFESYEFGLKKGNEEFPEEGEEEEDQKEALSDPIVIKFGFLKFEDKEFVLKTLEKIRAEHKGKELTVSGALLKLCKSYK